MKNTSTSNRSHSSSRLFVAFLAALLGSCALLVVLGAMSKTFAARIGAPHTLPIRSGTSFENHLARNDDFGRRMDNQGNRAAGPSAVQSRGRGVRVLRPAGSGNWSSLGPPGGDVSDVAVSTVDSNIA